MKVLAVDTTLNALGICLMDSGKIQGNYYAMCKKRQAEIIVPVIQELLYDVAVTLADIDAYVLCQGPGSYTGVRIGMSVIKSFAQVHKKPVIPVNTLQFLATQVPLRSQAFFVLLNCSRSDVFYARFEFQEGIPVALSPTTLSSLESLEDLKQKQAFFFKSITARTSKLAQTFTQHSLPSLSEIPETQRLYPCAQSQLQQQHFLPLKEVQPFYLKAEVSSNN